MSKRLPILAVVMTLGLSACQQNPLTKNSEEDTTRFLINASIAATKSMGLGLNDIEASRAYLNCMDGKVQKYDCSTLYAKMTKVADDARFSAFKGVSVAQLTDKDTYNRVREGYEQRFFMNNLEN